MEGSTGSDGGLQILELDDLQRHPELHSQPIVEAANHL